MDNYDELKKIEELLKVVLTLMMEKRNSGSEKLNDKNKKSNETLLSEAGFKAPEIAKIVGKNLSAVQKTIQRGRKQNAK